MQNLLLQRFDLAQSQGDQIKLFFYLFVFWMSIFTIINRKINYQSIAKQLNDDTKNRIVSIIHGFITFWYTFYICFDEQPQYSNANSWSCQFIMILSASYFAYDFMACVYYNLADGGLVAHHSLAICGYGVAVLSKFGATSSIMGLMYAESSNLPMHVRCILRNLNLRHTKAYIVCELSYFVIYSVSRGIFVPEMVYQTWTANNVPLLVRIVATGIFFQSIYYIKQMKNILVRHQKEYQERKSKGIELEWTTVTPRIDELSYTKKSKKDQIF